MMFKVIPVSWPSESEEKPSKSDTSSKTLSIMDYLSEKTIGMAINLPMRSGGCSGSGTSARRTSMLSIRTRGYKFRRLAIELQVPLITDVKCAKLFVQVIISSLIIGYPLNSFATSEQVSSACPIHKTLSTSTFCFSSKQWNLGVLIDCGVISLLIFDTR